MNRSLARTIYLLKRAETTVRLRLEDALRNLSVTPGQYTTMAMLRSSRQVSSAALARQVGVTPQSMSEMIVALERKGWIERDGAPENKRILRIGLSAEGKALIRRCDERVDAMERKLLQELTQDQLTGLREALTLIGQQDRDGGRGQTSS